MTVRVNVQAAASTVPSSYYQSNVVPLRHSCKMQWITLGQIGSLCLACYTSVFTDTVACWWLFCKPTLMKSLSMHTSYAGFYDEHIATFLVKLNTLQVVEWHRGRVISNRLDEMTCKPSHNGSPFCFKYENYHITYIRLCLELMASSGQLRSSIQTWPTLFIQT